MTELKDDQLFELLFHQLVLSLSETAMVQLGKIMHPVSHKVERDLTQARSTIDLLRMFQARTKGNLNEQEQKLLDQSVLSLQMNYVYEQDQDRKGGKPAAGDKPAENGPTAPAGGPVAPAGGEATPPPAAEA